MVSSFPFPSIPLTTDYRPRNSASTFLQDVVAVGFEGYLQEIE